MSIQLKTVDKLHFKNISKSFLLNSVLYRLHKEFDYITLGDMKRYYYENIMNNKFKVYAMYRNNLEFIGCWTYVKENNSLFIYDFFIIEEMRKKGYGSIMLKEACKNKYKIYLKSKEDTLKFYIKNNFCLSEYDNSRKLYTLSFQNNDFKSYLLNFFNF